MSNWYQNEAVNSDIAVSSRIRIARNLKGIPFPSKMSLEQKKELNKKVKSAITNSNSSLAKSLKYIEMRDIPENQRFAMVERHIISPEFAAKGIIISDNENDGEVIAKLDDGRFIVFKETGGTLRGIHFGEDDWEENAPMVADILNGDAVDLFIKITHKYSPIINRQ